MKVRRTPPPYPEVEAARALANHGRTCNNAPKNMLLKVGTNTNDVRHEAIEVLEEDGDAPITDVVLPTTRVSKDSAASSNVHIRIERANVQYRIDGVLLPDRGATSGSQLLETSLIGSVDLVTGAWSAQYGLQQPVSGTLTSDHPVTEGVPSSPTGGAHVCAAMGQRTSERRMSQ